MQSKLGVIDFCSLYVMSMVLLLSSCLSKNINENLKGNKIRYLLCMLRTNSNFILQFIKGTLHSAVNANVSNKFEVRNVLH